MDKINVDTIADILSGAYLQAVDEVGEPFNKNDTRARERWFNLVENEMIARGIAECDTPNCRADHAKRINKKYLLS